MGFKYIELNLDQLLLDEENLRLGLSESDALLALFEYRQDHLRNLARSIAENGLDPGDSFYVVASRRGPRFTVLDGNRRLAALLLLTDSERLDAEGLSQSTRRSLAALSAGFDRPSVEPFRCVLFDSEEAAAPWIRRRHTGTMDGEGRVPWNTVGVQRASGDEVVADVVGFIGRNAGFSQEKREELLQALMKGKATTFKRLLDSSRGRQFLGVGTESVDSRTRPFFEADPNRILRVLVQIVNDLLEGDVNTRTVHSAVQVDEYFSKLPSALQPVAGETQVRHSFRDFVVGGPPPPEPPSPTKPPPKKKPAERPQTKLAPREHEFDTSTSAKFGSLVREAEGLSIRLYPLASAFLLRTIVELAVNRYARVEGLPKGGKLSGRAEAVAKHMFNAARIRKSELQVFRLRLISPNSPCSIQSLNGFVHEERALPTTSDLLPAWEAAVPLFIAVYGKV